MNEDKVIENEPTRVAVFTGSRSEYGLMKNLIRKIQKDPVLSLSLFVSGSHLSSNHGNTVNEIEEDGIPIAALMPILGDDDCKSLNDLHLEAVKMVRSALNATGTRLIILLGDRSETFSAATAAFFERVGILHLHAGETTEGAIDNKLRHAISQLSDWHFTASDEYSHRVAEMTGRPDSVFNVGPMILDAFSEIREVTRESFEVQTGFRFSKKNILITYHPETLRFDYGIAGLNSLLHVLKGIDCNVLFTYPNADPGWEMLLKLVLDFVAKNPTRSWIIPSLGQQKYLMALKLFDVMAGNSSSGVIEAPLADLPVLNIGDRQKGRTRHENVIDVGHDHDDILMGLNKVLGMKGLKCSAVGRCSGGELPSDAVLRILKSKIIHGNVLVDSYE
jgi:UDP-hydrolysing UDP-N-acetyl-D-glucosamine 2-epimerase